MKLDPVLLEILVCPACKSSLDVDNDNDELICTGCGLIYPVRDDIPVMLVDEARRSSAGEPSGAQEDAAADMPGGVDAPPDGVEGDGSPEGTGDVGSERTS